MIELGEEDISMAVIQDFILIAEITGAAEFEYKGIEFTIHYRRGMAYKYVLTYQDINKHENRISYSNREYAIRNIIIEIAESEKPKEQQDE